MDPRYPVGKFQFSGSLSDSELHQAIADIEYFPAQLRAATATMTNAQLDTPYRAGGWTVRQVVHHVADSHMHSYLRFKFAGTADNPSILAYPEQIWAELDDARTAPIESSLRLLEGLHQRWVQFLRTLDKNSIARAFVHPEQGPVTLERATALYAWHCRHHLAHVQSVHK